MASRGAETFATSLYVKLVPKTVIIQGPLEKQVQQKSGFYRKISMIIMLEQWNVTAVEYFRACCEILGRERVGIYGHSRVISWAVEDGVIANLGGEKHLTWQTIAWSWGELSSEAVLFQRAGQVTVDGIEYDINNVWHPY